MIAADLMASDATGDVHDRVTEATATVGATMEIFVAGLSPDRRSWLLSDLPGTARWAERGRRHQGPPLAGVRSRGQWPAHDHGRAQTM